MTVTRSEFDQLKRRMALMTGYNRKVWSFEGKLRNILDEQRLLRNEIKSLRMQVQKLKKRRLQR